MRKILVLGHKGMLGQAVTKYFSASKFDIVTTDLRFDKDNLELWSTFIKSNDNCVIINCIGRIKQKTDDTYDLLWANAVLPLQIANIMLPNQFLIHPSTDCVFAGDKGEPYSIYDSPDATDAYGWSKRLGEVSLKNNSQAIVIRVSIIGIDVSPNPKGLLGWFLSQPNNAILNGFNNHFWNGITTIEWCKQVEKVIQNIDNFRNVDMLQLGTAVSYSKHDMLHIFQKVYGTQYSITPMATETSIDRRLSPTIISESLGKQLEEMKLFFK